MNISALILAKNEQELIEDCIKQLSFANEIIVLDNNSLDDTAKIAKRLNCKVVKAKSNNFSKNRNQLKNEASGQWLLYLDADERIDSENLEEIKNAASSSKYSAYYFPRKNYILGKFLKHGGWYPDYVPRLFKKGKLISWTGDIHESPKVDGSFGYLKNPINHFTARTFEDMFKKTINWAKIEADLSFKAYHTRINGLKIVKAIVSEFTARYFIKKGFLDGYVGTIEAMFQAMHRAVTLIYIWEMQNKSRTKIEDE